MIYLKDINGIPKTAPDELHDETGFYPAFNQNVEVMTEKGYLPFDEGDYSMFLAGAKLFINGEFVENTTPEYIKKQSLKQIEEELKQSDTDYNTVLNTPALYSNGHTYKPVYINDYVLLIASGMPYDIWSDDEIYYENMDTQQIIILSMFLKSIAEPQYQKRKMDRKALLTERATLV